MKNNLNNNGQIKILLFEDNPGDARLFIEAIRDISSTLYKTIHAESLSQGISILDEQRIDSIMLDLGLPDSQNIESLIKLKSQVLGCDFDR
ncbi:MAG TPA: hypothetical protein ENN23_00595 [Deltaproteobacteria bacterium]|nr:hypothetical protein [Deltaproteobacteria bacterium]